RARGRARRPGRRRVRTRPRRGVPGRAAAGRRFTGGWQRTIRPDSARRASLIVVSEHSGDFLDSGIYGEPAAAGESDPSAAVPPYGVPVSPGTGWKATLRPAA